MEILLSLEYFFWLCTMLPSLVLYAWPVTLTIIIFTVFSIFMWFKQYPRANIRWDSLAGCCLIMFLILLYGTFHRAGENWQPQPYSQYVDYVVNGFLSVQFILSGLVIYRANYGARLLSLSILVWAFYFSVSASFITLMAVTGDWL